LPRGCEVIRGSALEANSYAEKISPAQTFIHLIGVAHPSPTKKDAFTKIDLLSIKHAVSAATSSGIRHFIYLSVAQYPSKIMKDYQAIRAEGEKLLIKSTIPSSFVRPWYVLGPGHWWPLLLKPFWGLAALFPATREMSQKLDAVTIQQMMNTLVFAVKNPPLELVTVYEVKDIKTSEKIKPSHNF
jgi:nucleoside-diphosphate-sugar epimerase